MSKMQENPRYTDLSKLESQLGKTLDAIATAATVAMPDDAHAASLAIVLASFREAADSHLTAIKNLVGKPAATAAA
jgi:hypothetical protein